MDAAEQASRVARSTVEYQIPHSSIPLIVHQTWKNTRIDTWPHEIRQSTERWLRVINGQMAYFLWDDEGIAQFIRRFEPGLEEQFYALPSHVEQSDVFRVLVSKWIGGVVSQSAPCRAVASLTATSMQISIPSPFSRRPRGSPQRTSHPGRITRPVTNTPPPVLSRALSA